MSTSIWRELPLLGLLTRFTCSPEQGADTAVWLATDLSVAGVSRRCFKDRSPMATSRHSHDPELARGLWEHSERLVRSAAAAAIDGDGR